MKTQKEIEAAICQAINRFERDYMGGIPKNIQGHLIGDILVIRLRGVLTAAEQHLVKSLAADRGRELVKQVRKHLVETARPIMQETLLSITGARVQSMHHDISTTTGEEILLFTFVQPPLHQDSKQGHRV